MIKMVEITATQMIATFLATNPEVQLPLLKSKTPVADRIRAICFEFQWPEIKARIGDVPDCASTDNNAIQMFEEYRKKKDKLMSEGIGREKLERALPDYKSPERIAKIITEKYAKSPVDAGEYAQKYVGYNPFLSHAQIVERKLSEEFQTLTIPQTGDIIKTQMDLFDPYCIYEFKLTTESRLNETVKKAFLQLIVYDFVFRMTHNKRYHKRKMIEIYLVDKQEICAYEFWEFNKEILKNIIRINQLRPIDVVLDDIYDHLEVALEEDANFEERLIKETDKK